MPGSGYGRLEDFQRATILFLTAVTALNAGCWVSSSFLAADRYWPSALNVSAAWAFWSGVSVLRTPSQANDTRTAANAACSRWAGETVLVREWARTGFMVLVIGFSMVAGQTGNLLYVNFDKGGNYRDGLYPGSNKPTFIGIEVAMYDMLYLPQLHPPC